MSKVIRKGPEQKGQILHIWYRKIQHVVKTAPVVKEQLLPGAPWLPIPPVKKVGQVQNRTGNMVALRN